MPGKGFCSDVSGFTAQSRDQEHGAGRLKVSEKVPVRNESRSLFLVRKQEDYVGGFGG